MHQAGRPMYGCWVLACAAAEAIGMTTAAVAARLGADVSEGGEVAARWLALGVIVAGGLVEGAALGLLQSWALTPGWPTFRRGRFVLATVLVAGVGWAGASAPGALAGDDGGAEPARLLVVLGGAGIGVVMGPVLGAAQAWALQGTVRHPWRWVVANTVAWPLAMGVIFLGATSPGDEWTLLAVAGCGTLTGAVAGSALGFVSGGWLGSLDGPTIGNRVVLAMVAGERFGVERRLVGLALTGRRTGQQLRLPVQYAELGTELVVVPGHPETKTWWRNLSAEARAVWVLDGHGWHTGSGRMLRPGDPGYAPALAAYRLRWPRFQPPDGQPVVVLHVIGPGIPAVSAGF